MFCRRLVRIVWEWYLNLTYFYVTLHIVCTDVTTRVFSFVINKIQSQADMLGPTQF